MSDNERRHVDLSVIFRLDHSLEKRIEYIDEQWHMELPTTHYLIERISNLIRQPSRIRPKCMLVLAESGMGKSYVAEEIVRQNQPHRDKKAGVIHRPVLCVEPVPQPTVSNFLYVLASAAEIPVHAIPAHNLHAHIAHQLKAMNSRLIMVDEAQMFSDTSPNASRACCNQLKWIGNVTRRPVVALGTPDAKVLFSRDSQLASRFQVEELLPWAIGPELQSFVKTMLTQLPMREPWDAKLLTEAGIRALHKKTRGITGSIIQCIKDGAVDTLQQGRESIRIEDVVGAA